jgi:hypothetical protein
MFNDLAANVKDQQPLMKDAGIIAKIPKKPHYYPAGNEMPRGC